MFALTLPTKIKLGFGAAATAIGLVLAGCDANQNEAVAQTAAIPATDVGINLTGLNWYNFQRSFANLAATNGWLTAGTSSWQDMPQSQLTSRGWVTGLSTNQFAPMMLGLPDGPFDNKIVRCSFLGQGQISADGFVRPRVRGKNYIDLTFNWPQYLGANGWIQINQTNPADPLRKLDCRESGVPRDALYAPAFIDSLKGFSTLRFLDWQGVNGNQGGNWSRFHPIDGQFKVSNPEGVRVEDMVALANEVKADPWFSMPYNADETYLRNFARYVRLNLDPSLKVHVELGNEVWNYVFGATQQAAREGKALGLSNNDHEAMLRRYSQKSRYALAIWTEAYRDAPDRLVRIIGTQNVSPDAVSVVLSHGDTAQFVDAVATAPYIQMDLTGKSVNDVDAIFGNMDRAIDEAIGFAATNKATAQRYGKRYLAYEAGQHLVTSDLDLQNKLQRDPRMGGVYTRYLERWRDRVGGRIVLYQQTGGISRHGAWGLREYGGQPVTQAPKWQAVQAFINPR